MTKAWAVSSDGIRLHVRVQPGTSANRVENIWEAADGTSRLKVRVTAAPEKGKANKAVQKLLAKEFGIAASAMELIAGEIDRNKTFLISVAADPLISEFERRFAN